MEIVFHSKAQIEPTLMVIWSPVKTDDETCKGEVVTYIKGDSKTERKDREREKERK